MQRKWMSVIMTNLIWCFVSFSTYLTNLIQFLATVICYWERPTFRYFLFSEEIFFLENWIENLTKFDDKHYFDSDPETL